MEIIHVDTFLKVRFCYAQKKKTTKEENISTSIDESFSVGLYGYFCHGFCHGDTTISGFSR